MRLPNSLKIGWWLLLVGVLTFFLRQRLPDLLNGKAAAADISVFGVWIALLLAPLFNEVTLLGVTLKSEIDELKSHIAAQIADIRNAVDVRTTVSPTFNIPSPPTDAQLPAIEAQVKAAVSAAFAEQGQAHIPQAGIPPVPQDANFLFATRFHIESELRRLASTRNLSIEPRRALSISTLSRWLVDSGLLSPPLGGAIREVYSVCSPAIHGEAVSEAQLEFVRDVAPGLISALQTIE